MLSVAAQMIFLLPALVLPSMSHAVRLYGVNYSLRIGPDWTQGAERCKSAERVREELLQLRNDFTSNVRVYSVTDCDTANIMLPITRELGMGLWLGIWVGPDGSVFDDERQRLNEVLSEHSTDHLLGIHVSSEAVFRGDITVEQAVGLRNTIRNDIDLDIPITISDIYESNRDFPEMLSVDDSVVTFNQFPFWDQTTDVNKASNYMSERVAILEDRAGGRQRQDGQTLGGTKMRILLIRKPWRSGFETLFASLMNADGNTFGSHPTIPIGGD